MAPKGSRGPGICLTRGTPQKWLGEGAKGLWTQRAKVSEESFAQGAKVSEESFAPPKPDFAPVQPQPHFALVPKACCSLGPKDLLPPVLTTFGEFPFRAPKESKVSLRSKKQAIFDLQSLVFVRGKLKGKN